MRLLCPPEKHCGGRSVLCIIKIPTLGNLKMIWKTSLLINKEIYVNPVTTILKYASLAWELFWTEDGWEAVGEEGIPCPPTPAWNQSVSFLHAVQTSSRHFYSRAVLTKERVQTCVHTETLTLVASVLHSRYESPPKAQITCFFKYCYFSVLDCPLLKQYIGLQAKRLRGGNASVITHETFIYL